MTKSQGGAELGHVDKHVRPLTVHMTFMKCSQDAATHIDSKDNGYVELFVAWAGCQQRQRRCKKTAVLLYIMKYSQMCMPMLCVIVY